MLTPREHALSVFGACRAMGTGTVLGADAEEVRRSRLAFIDRAIAAVAKAVGTQRNFLAEPSDDDLDAMRAWLRARRELLDPDATAAGPVGRSPVGTGHGQCTTAPNAAAL